MTPAHPGKLIWGVGPMFSFPTATASPVKTGSWAGGFDGRPMTLSAQYYYNVTKPDGAAGQLLRISVSLLYPRK